MAYAHQGVELKPLPLPGLASPGRARVASNAGNSNAKSDSKSDIPQRPSLLTKRAADILVRVEQMMDDAAHALASRPSEDRRAENGGAAPPPGRSDSLAAASDQIAGGRPGDN
jgi:penicillin-binding protein 1A